jgi:hypothetical protein
MAYTTSPEFNTYSTEKIPLVYDLRVAPGFTTLANPYSGMQNLFPVLDSDGKTVVAESRPAIMGKPVFVDTTGASSDAPIARGMYVWEKSVGTVYYFSVFNFNGSGYVYGSSDMVNWTNLQTIASATTPVRFTEFIDNVNTKKLIMVDGTHGWVFTGLAAGTQIVDANFPTPHVPFPIFMDGYLFLAKAGTADVYNSNLNDPTTWTAGDFLSAEMYPDDIQALVKINNYILAVGTKSCEYFYDAGNSPGTPLAKYESVTHPFGCAIPNSIASNENMAVMMANSGDGGISIKLIRDFEAADLPADAILQILQTQFSGPPYFPGSLSTAGIRGCLLRYKDDLFYFFNLFGNSPSPDPNLHSYAYSFTHKIWIKLVISQPQLNTSVDYAFPVYFTAPATSSLIQPFICGVFNSENWTGTGTIGSPAVYNYVFFGVLDPMNSSGIDLLTPNVSGLFSGAYSMGIVHKIWVPPLDFGTQNRKVMNRLGLNYTSYATLPMTVSWSDDLMNTWTTKTLEGIVGGNASVDGGFPFLFQLGNFRRRGFRLQGYGLTRYNYLEVDINKGIR